MALTHKEHFPDFRQGAMILIDKPIGWTSFDVVNKIRRHIGVKVGHAGTLDPLATGLLILCTGKKTRELGTLSRLDKSYTGTLTFGGTTPSYDAETGIDRRFDISHLDQELINAAILSFIGEIEQVPPAYSAVKIKGEPAYKKARRGQPVVIPPRKVIIHAFRATRIALPDADFEVSCSKGTYIRSLVHDLGMKLGAGAYLKSLRRTRIGDHRIEDAWILEDFLKEERDMNRPNPES